LVQGAERVRAEGHRNAAFDGYDSIKKGMQDFLRWLRPCENYAERLLGKECPRTYLLGTSVD